MAVRPSVGYLTILRTVLLYSSTEGVGGHEWLSVGIVGGPNVVEDLLTFVWRAASIVLVL